MTPLPGVYEAKVTSSSPTSLTLLIPQAFRDQQVPCTHWVGGVPATNVRGFVSFIGGDPAWPVWLGVANS